MAPQTASVTEESASAAEQLSAQAQTVKGMVGELVAMVGGADAQLGKRAGMTPRPAAKTAKGSPEKHNPLKLSRGSNARKPAVHPHGEAELAPVASGDDMADF